MEEKNSNWFSSLPGLLTAGATFITALGGLIVILQAKNSDDKKPISPDSEIKKTEVVEEKKSSVTQNIIMRGNVGKLSAVFNLKKNENSSEVSGTYYYPARARTRKARIYQLSGKMTDEQIEMTEYTDHVKTATINVHKTANNCYDGQMQNTNGNILPVNICIEP